MGHPLISAQCVAKWGIAQMRQCETKCQGRLIETLWVSANLPSKHRMICYMRAAPEVQGDEILKFWM